MFAVLFLSCLVLCGAHAQDYPFRNWSLPFEERVQDLVGRLSLQEMVGQMAHGGANMNGPAPAISRLGINPYQWGTECLSGDVNAGPATSFPQAIGMSATFHYDMVYRFAKATSDEVRAKNNNYTSHGDYGFHTGLSCWSPVINIFRDPRWGRNQETYGEDPWLSGYLAKAYVTGLQGDHPRYVEANAGCKHFDVHGGPENIPVSRFSFDAKVSERDWRMTFLPQFKACVEAGSWSIMCSYNRVSLNLTNATALAVGRPGINGVPACANKKLLTDILRGEWGFKGYVVSDQGAIELVWLGHEYTSNLVDTAAACVNAGTCLEDGNLYTILNAFDHIGEAVGKREHWYTQFTTGCLRVAILHAKNIMTKHHYTSTIPQTAAAAVNAGTSLEDANYYDCVFNHIGDAVNMGLISTDTVKDAVSRLFMVRMRLGEFDPPSMNPYTKLNPDTYIQSEAHRELSLQAALESFVLLKNSNDQQKGLPVTQPVNRACVVGPFIDTPSVLFGDYAPTIMEEYVVTPLSGIRSQTQIGTQTLNSAAGCNDGPKCHQYSSNDVRNACNGVDLAIVCLGTSSQLEGEGNDRADINFPGSQLQLLQDAASAASGPTILVLYNAGPLDISWAKESSSVVAILEHFFPAQSAGSALAQVLTGKYNPAGRLPNTWPASLSQVPPITNYTMVNRTYRYFQGDPLYPFGYGLSYTQFNYSSLSVSPSSVKSGDNVTVKVVVSNTGSMDGDEVTQVYISWPNGTIPAPMRQLVGVARTTIAMGKSTSLMFVITSEQMQLFTTKWEILPGTMEVFVGGQQPFQKTQVPSNVLRSSFVIQG